MVDLKDDFNNSSLNNSDNPVTDNPVVNRGRPRLSFEVGSEKTKKRRADELSLHHNIEELIKACERKKENPEFNLEMKANNILAMYIDIDLTARKYKKLRTHSTRITGTNAYPPYSNVVQAKTHCLPEHLKYSESGASANLISLLEHTTKRILLLFDKDVLMQLSGEKLVLVGKWGMDGASGQQTTRQK